MQWDIVSHLEKKSVMMMSLHENSIRVTGIVKGLVKTYLKSLMASKTLRK